MMDSYLQM